jgi:hypothetical protein
MDEIEVQKDLNFLVENPEKTLVAAYHDAGSCWLLIEAAVKEIRTLRHELSEARRKGKPQK